MCMVYMTQALDKGALGPVSIMGWLEDVNAQGQGTLSVALCMIIRLTGRSDFAMTSTLMWIGIICGEPLVSYTVCATSVHGIGRGSASVLTDDSGKSTCEAVPHSQNPRRFHVHLDCCKCYHASAWVEYPLSNVFSCCLVSPSPLRSPLFWPTGSCWGSPRVFSALAYSPSQSSGTDEASSRSSLLFGSRCPRLRLLWPHFTVGDSTRFPKHPVLRDGNGSSWL